MLHKYTKNRNLVNTIRVLRNEQLKRAGYIEILDGRLHSRYGVDSIRYKDNETEIDYAKKMLWLASNIEKYNKVPIQLFIMMFGEVIALGSSMAIKQIMYKPNIRYKQCSVKSEPHGYSIGINNVSSAYFKRCNALINDNETEIKKMVLEVINLDTKDLKW